jgi:photosystem II stability/assembly factor-like uncharacterized protein
MSHRSSTVRRQSSFGVILGAVLLLGGQASASVVLADGAGNARSPQIAFSGNVLHAVATVQSKIVYYRSSNRGASWQSKSIGDVGIDLAPHLAVRGSSVFVAWNGKPTVNSPVEVYFTRSVDAGESFGPAQLLTANDGLSTNLTGLDASPDGSRVVVSYWDRRRVEHDTRHSNLFVRVSNSRGAAGSWGPETVLNDPYRILDFEQPVARFLPTGELGTVFQANPGGFPQGGFLPRAIHFIASHGGTAGYYREPKQISDARPVSLGDCTFPSVLLDAAGGLHVAWFERRAGRHVMYSRSESGGHLWSEPQQLSSHAPIETSVDATPGPPAIVAMGDRVEVLWSTPRERFNSGDAHGPMMRAVSVDRGASFAPAVTLRSAGTAAPAAAATDGRDVFVVYSFALPLGNQGVAFDTLTTAPPSTDVPASGPAVAAVLALLLLAAAWRHLRVPRRMLLCAAAAVSLLGAPGRSAAQQPLPLDGGSINGLYRTTAGVLFAATDGAGVYRSQDGGDTWSRSDSGLDEPAVLALAGDGSSGVLAATERGVYRSTDGGSTWSRRVRARVSSVLVVPGNPDLCFAGTRGGGVLRSDDGGATWRAAGSAGLGSLDVTSMDFGAGRLWAATAGAGLHVSTDGGVSWQRRAGGGPSDEQSYISRVRVDPASPGVVFFGTDPKLAPALRGVSGGNVFVSYDAGARFALLNTQIGFFGVASIEVVGGRLFVGTTATGLYATDLGYLVGTIRWAGWNASVRDIVATPDGRHVWLALRGSGVYRSTDSGASYQPASRGIHAFHVRGIAVDGQNVLFAVEGGMLRSSDGGASLSFSNQGLSRRDSLAVDMLAVAAAGGGRVYASSFEDGFYVSDDHGATWVRRDPADWRAIYKIAIGSNRDHVITGGRGGVLHVSQNAGVTWSDLRYFSGNDWVSGIALKPGDPSAMVITTYQASYARSGGVFTPIGDPLAEGMRMPFTDVVSIPAANRQIAASLFGILTRSLSFGATPEWTWRFSGLRDSSFTALVVHPQSPSKVVAAAYGSGLYVSDDGGLNWRFVDLGTRQERVTALAALNGSTMLFGTAGAGAYRMPWP